MEQYLLVNHDLLKFFDMKLLIVIFLTVFAFFFCVPTNRIIVINDSANHNKGFKLIQNLKTTSSAKTGKTIVNQFFNTEVIYQFEEKNTVMPLVSLDFYTTKAIRADELDSIMYLNLDNEKIRIVANMNKQKMVDPVPASTENKPISEATIKPTQKTQNSNATDRKELLSRQYDVPENLWLSIAHSKDISYSLSIAKTGIVVKLNPEEKTKVKAFFSRAMQRRLEIIPLLPPGKARW